MIVIKLGGSVITDKRTEGKVRRRIIDRLIREIKVSEKKTVIVHGAGSFGHIPARKYSLHEGFKDDGQLSGLLITHNNVRILNMEIMKSLQRYDIPAVSIPPLCFVEMENGSVKRIDLRLFGKAISLGLTPVSFGDVVFDSARGFSICSGDDLVLHLSLYFKPEKVIFVMDEDGVFDRDPKKHRNAKFLKEIEVEELPVTEASSYVDVTGGMKKKIEIMGRIASCGMDVFVVNGNKIGRLYGVLVGKNVKRTRIAGCEK